MARSAGVLAKLEDGGAYKAYRHYRYLRLVHIREQQMAKIHRSLAPLRGDYRNQPRRSG